MRGTFDVSCDIVEMLRIRQYPGTNALLDPSSYPAMDTARHEERKHTGLRIEFATLKLTTLADVATLRNAQLNPHVPPCLVHLQLIYFTTCFWKQCFLMQDSLFIVTRCLLSPA